MNVRSNAFLAMIILFSSSLAVLVANNGTYNGASDRVLPFLPGIKPSVTHGKITINGNTQLASFFAGNSSDGTAGNPYIIQGFEINAGGVGSSIYIRDTNKYLVIQNCNLRGGNGTGFTFGGISLYNCSNVIIRWNTATQNPKFGIIVDESTSIFITGNTISFNNQTGIEISYSDHVTITDNTISNIKYGGISANFCKNVTVSRNSITNIGGIGIAFSDGKPPLMITNNTISGCDDDGMSFDTVYHAVIANNTITQCDYYGFDIMNSCCDNNITQNLVTFCRFAGINFYNGDGNLTGNIIWFNAFLNNTDTQSQSRWLTPGENAWDFGGIGNYWGDYRSRYPNAIATNSIWSIPYEINETLYATDYDHYPLESINLITTRNPQDVGTMITIITIIVVLAFVVFSAMVVFKAYKEGLVFPKR